MPPPPPPTAGPPVNYLTLSAGAISTSGSLLIIFCYFAFPSQKSLWRRYLVVLSVFDGLQGLYFVLDGALEINKAVYNRTSSSRTFCVGQVRVVHGCVVWGRSVRVSAVRCKRCTPCMLPYVAGKSLPPSALASGPPRSA